MPIADIRLTHFDKEVYEPAEDSYMLADALDDEWKNAQKVSAAYYLSCLITSSPSQGYDVAS
eukprot:932674-Prorocentrum_minimum.AAC.1